MQRDQPRSRIARDETMFKQYVQIQRDADGLGLTLAGNAPTVVQSVVEDGPAARGGLKKGDALLEVNEDDVTNLNHHQVASLLGGSEMLFLHVLRRGQPEPASIKHNIAISTFEDVDGGDAHSTEHSLDETLEPFRSLAVLEAHPAHLATFIHYTLVSHTCQEELLFYLNASWFKGAPKAEDARVLFTDFLAPAAPMRVASIHAADLRAVEAAISEKNPNPVELQAVFERAAKGIESCLQDCLEQFRNQITVGLGDVVQFEVLQRMEPGEEAMVIETMLLPHVDSSGASTDDRAAHRAAIVDEALRIFLSRCNSASAGAELDASSGRERSHSFKGRKSKRRTHFIRGHQFMVSTYKSPTFCVVCDKLIWGLYCQGWDCQNCGIHLHKDKDRFGFSKCHTHLTEECPGKPEGKSKRSFLLGRNSRRKSRNKNNLAQDSNGSEPPPSPEMGRSLSEASVTSSSVRSGPGSLHSSFRKTSDAGHGDGELELPFGNLLMEPEIWDDTVEEQGLLKSLNKQEIKRQRSIYELIQTEKGFLRHLAIMQQVFRRTLVEEKVLSANQIYDLFCNVDDLIACSSPLAHALEARQQDGAGRPVERVGDEFKNAFSLVSLESYAKFCANQKYAAQLYSQLLESNIAFASTMARCERSPHLERLTLKDFLVKPFQRLTKYPLLLKNIISNTTDERELQDLQECTAQANQALKHVEAAIRRSEDRARLLEIESTMDKTGLNPEERQVLKGLSDSAFALVYERDVQLRSHDKVFDIRAILLTHALLLCQKKDNQLLVKLPGRDNKGRSPIIVLNSTIVRPNAGNPKSFFVMHTDKRGPQMYELVTTNKKDTEKWRALLTETGDAFRANFPGYEDQVKEAVAEAAAQDKEAAQANTLEEGLAQVLDEMLKNCSDNQRLLKAFDAKLHDSGLGELAAKVAEDTKVRTSSMSSRRDRRALRSRGMSGRPRNRSHSAAPAMLPQSSREEDDISPMRSTPSPQAIRRMGRSFSVEEESVARSDTSPAGESAGSVSNGLVHMRELAAARVEIAQLQHQVARLQKQLFHSHGGQLSDPEEEVEEGSVEDESVGVSDEPFEELSTAKAKRPSLTLQSSVTEQSRESAV
eukprot:m.168863 g.168863  ORF g.168863 m.168863 type:complete len:1106 (-) comp16659_c0_seq2:61-3378(-)